ncbi:MAG: peptidoglycan-binding protein [Curvibacter sp.]|nr:peptidoglycan-binding protein [Curvibacter sp.]
MARPTNKTLTLLALAASLAALGGCATMDTGSAAAKTEATGSAGGENSQGANAKLPRCAETLGTLAIVEDTNSPWYLALTQQYKLGPTTPVLKLLVQQSNCFVIVDRGRAMNNMMQERALAQSGELRTNSNFGKGQMVSADYSLTPSITFSNNNAGHAGAALGGLLGPVGALVGGSMSAKEASTMLTLDDNRSSVQVAAAEGSAKNWDFGAFGGILGAGFGGLGGGYTNTAEGKVIVAAFLDAYANIVKAVQNYKAQTVKGGLGTGGRLGVDGAGNAAPAAAAAASAPAAGGMTVLAAQQKLSALGFDVGKPDGSMGPRTHRELAKFQKSRQIPATGELDDATKAELSK